MPAADADALKAAYLALRRAGHARALAGADKGLHADELIDERALVQRLWTDTMHDDAMIPSTLLRSLLCV